MGEATDLATAAGADDPRVDCALWRPCASCWNAWRRCKYATHGCTRSDGAADQVVPVQARNARVQGLSWQEIVKELGVTRQAVHNKYGRR